MNKFSKPLACLVLVLCIGVCFTSCSSDKAEVSTTKPEASTVIPYDSDLIYYDKKGNAYESLSELKFYDENGGEYTYVELLESPYFVDKNGNKLDGEKSFVDKNGYFIYDEKGEIDTSEKVLEGKDKNGNVYYPAATVRWTVDGTMVIAFGMGEEIIPEK